MAILEVAQLEKSFGGTKVLQDISFSLEEGQALSIIGSSGSGKTTLLRCLNFLETPDSGRIAVRGRNLLDGKMILYIISCIREDHELKLDGSFPSILLYCLKIAQCEYR